MQEFVPLLGSSQRRSWISNAWAAGIILVLVGLTTTYFAAQKTVVLLARPDGSGTMLEESDCTTDHCRMTRQCSVHTGDQSACFAVEPLCAECGERKPCYYAFGKCKLRNGYGPPDKGFERETAESPTAAAQRKLGGSFGGIMDEGVAADDEGGVKGNPVLSVFESEKIAKGGMTTIDPRHGAHEAKTPAKVNKLANITDGEGPQLQDGPRLQFCQWGSEMVPCAPGYGGAWLEHHTEDAGIWPNVPDMPHAHVRHHVKAGRRSHPYLDDFFQYGSGGIFGAKKIGGPTVAAGRMLAGGHTNTQRRRPSSVLAAAAWRQAQAEAAAAEGGVEVKGLRGAVWGLEDGVGAGKVVEVERRR